MTFCSAISALACDGRPQARNSPNDSGNLRSALVHVFKLFDSNLKRMGSLPCEAKAGIEESQQAKILHFFRSLRRRLYGYRFGSRRNLRRLPLSVGVRRTLWLRLYVKMKPENPSMSKVEKLSWREWDLSDCRIPPKHLENRESLPGWRHARSEGDE